MDRGVRNTLLWLLGFIALVLVLFFYSFLSTRELNDEQYQSLGFYRFETPRALRPFSLVDTTGASVDNSALAGHWTLMFFGYTFCPDVCPTTLAVLAKSLGKMKQKPQVVLVSVDPERDTPDRLGQYVHGFDPSFKGFTGTFDNIVSLATDVNIAFGKVPGPTPGTYLVDHSAVVLVFDPRGRYQGFIKPPHDSDHIATIMNSLM
ncbi:MAG: SCO family protein [Pseudomonadales bacterium]|nr:SCO family protein [Pseudomonadales bacterium]